MPPDLLSPEDEALLDELFDHAVACLATGARIDVESWLAGREHLRAAAEAALETARGVAVGTAPRLPHGKPPEVAGYRVLEEVGRGSMGIVYRAVQESLARAVALKILSPSLLVSARARERFAAEAQALARVQHPSVVVVHEVVVQPELCAYAMEWLAGRTLAQAIEAGDARLGDARRVAELGLALASALEAVHAAGLVHRDVKPSNVLLCFDGRVVLTDFGLAHSAEQGQGTASGEFLGTAAYAAPEQLRGDRERVGARSDVYALGVTLYVALTGQTPFGTATPSAVLRRIEEGRAQPLAKLNPAVPRDLATIVGKAMEPELARRYASATELAEDLERFLAQRPIRARRASLALRGKRWVQRNPWLCAALVVLAAGAGTSTWFALEARSQTEEAREQQGLAEQHERVSRRRAEENERLAEEKSVLASAESVARTAAEANAAEARQRAKELEQVLAFQEAQWMQVNVATMGLELRKMLLARVTEERRKDLEAQLEGLNFTGIVLQLLAQQLFDRSLTAIHEGFADRPVLRAALLHGVGRTLGIFGLSKSAVAPLSEALQLRREALGEKHGDTIASMTAMGTLERDRGRLDEAEKLLRTALEASREVLGEEDPRTIDALFLLATTLSKRGDAVGAEDLDREALEICRRALGPEHELTLKAMNNVGTLLQNARRFAEAEPLLRDAVEGALKSLGENAALTLMFQQNFSVLLGQLGQREQAEEIERTVLAKRRILMGDDHPQTLDSMRHLGISLVERKATKEGHELLREVFDRRRRILGRDHPSTLHSLVDVATILLEQRKSKEAKLLLSEAMDSIRRTKGFARPEASVLANLLAKLLHEQGALEEAVKLARETLEARAAANGVVDSATVSLMGRLGLVLNQQGQLEEAEQALRAALPLQRQNFGADEEGTLMSVLMLAHLLGKQRRPAEAVELLVEFEDAARRGFAKVKPAPLLASYLLALGRARVDLGTADSLASAEATLLEALQLFEANKLIAAASKSCTQELVRLYERWNALQPSEERAARLAEWRARLEKLDPKR